MLSKSSCEESTSRAEQKLMWTEQKLCEQSKNLCEEIWMRIWQVHQRCWIPCSCHVSLIFLFLELRPLPYNIVPVNQKERGLFQTRPEVWHVILPDVCWPFNRFFVFVAPKWRPCHRPWALFFCRLNDTWGLSHACFTAEDRRTQACIPVCPFSLLKSCRHPVSLTASLLSMMIWSSPQKLWKRCRRKLPCSNFVAIWMRSNKVWSQRIRYLPRKNLLAHGNQ